MGTLVPILIALLLGPISAASADQSLSDSCLAIKCSAGTRAITYSAGQDTYYACPTRKLVRYVDTVIGMVSMQMSLGSAPDISPTTGEPEYTGESKQLLDVLRKNAGVSTFDEAVHQCRKGRNGVKVIVINESKGTNEIWVTEAHRKRSFWMSKAYLDPIGHK